MEDESRLDQITLSTLSLLESRLQRLEHLVCGREPAPFRGHGDSALQRLQRLERRFSSLTSGHRVYGELLNIYRSHPDFFHATDPSQPPSQLSPEAVRAIVLASAPSFPAMLSALTAIKDCPVPDPSRSAALIALVDRMKAIEATQLAQAAEVAELRERSEALVHAWYVGEVLPRSRVMADLESRVGTVERDVRRKERQTQWEREGI